MKLAVVYYLGSYRRSQLALKTWQHFYEKSECKYEPVLLADEHIRIPSYWNYSCVKIKDSEPIFRTSIWDKIAWISSQAYEHLGACLVFNLNCFIAYKFVLEDYQKDSIITGKDICFLNHSLIKDVFQQEFKNHISEMGNDYPQIVYNHVKDRLDGKEFDSEFLKHFCKTDDLNLALRNLVNDNLSYFS